MTLTDQRLTAAQIWPSESSEETLKTTLYRHRYGVPHGLEHPREFSQMLLRVYCHCRKYGVSVAPIVIACEGHGARLPWREKGVLPVPTISTNHSKTYVIVKLMVGDFLSRWLLDMVWGTVISGIL